MGIRMMEPTRMSISKVAFSPTTIVTTLSTVFACVSSFVFGTCWTNVILIFTPVAHQWFLARDCGGLDDWFSRFSRIPLSRAFEIAVVELSLG